MISRTASSIFAARGYHKTSIEDICKECNIAQGTLYLHFSGKLEIFKMAVNDALDKIYEIVKPIDISRNQDQKNLEHGVFDYIYKKNHQLFKAILENRSLLKIVFLEAIGLDDEINKLISRATKMITGMVETELSVFKSMGLIREVDTKISSIITVGTMQMVMYAMFDDNELVKDVDHLALKVTEYQLYGISKNTFAKKAVKDECDDNL
ncbi:MAG: TetR/AcrR family transcriptional regulator [Leptospirales bacterium]|nr:TetR/AcrR family transcriptional regulator [Leptospirales bacterium]